MARSDTRKDDTEPSSRLEQEIKSIASRVDTLGGVISEMLRKVELHIGKLDMMVPRSEMKCIEEMGTQIRERQRRIESGMLN